jgi:hypothetical protein
MISVGNATKMTLVSGLLTSSKLKVEGYKKKNEIRDVHHTISCVNGNE